MGARSRQLRLRAAGLVWLAVAYVFRPALEASLVLHVVLQLPLLVVAGMLLVPQPAEDGRRAAPDRKAVPVLLVALFAGVCWMLPRLLDASLVDPWILAAKLTSLPLFLGIPLGWSWPRLAGITRAFVLANIISMLVTLAWLYLAAPVRLCNFYRLDEQAQLGETCLAIAAAIVVFALLRVFGAGSRQSSPQSSALRFHSSAASSGSRASEEAGFSLH